MTISKEDTVFVKTKFGLKKLGDGFDSEEEVEEAIEELYSRDSGEYVFGVFSEVGSVNIPEPERKSKTLPQEALDRFESISERAETDPRVESYHLCENPNTPTMVTLYTQNIRYYEECDFEIYLDETIFESPPISTLDTEVESQVSSIFNEIVGSDGIFLGYDSGYASRGRRNPYVKVVGRLKRDTDRDKSLRSLYDLPLVAGVYWSNENIAPIRLHGVRSQSISDDEDVIAILDLQDDSGNLDEISPETIEKVDWVLSQIESVYDLEADWIGKIQYNRDFNYTCIGISYSGES